MIVPIGETAGLALSQVHPHLDSICVLSPKRDILSVLATFEGRVLCCNTISKVAKCRARQAVRSDAKESSNLSYCVKSDDQLGRVIFGLCKIGTRRESLVRWEHHMHRVAEWLATIYAWRSRRVIWKIASSCALNRVVLIKTPGGLRANTDAGTARVWKESKMQGSAEKYFSMPPPHHLLLRHIIFQTQAPLLPKLAIKCTISLTPNLLILFT